MTSSRHNLSRAQQLFHGTGQAGNYQGGKVGIELSHLYSFFSTPKLAVANGYALSQAIAAGALAVLNGTEAGSATVNGNTAVAGLADVARNVVGAWTTASTVTVTGVDQFGRPQTEVQTGAVFTGKKAFLTITSIKSSAAITAATFGNGEVLGLPFAIAPGGLWISQFNGAADAGTLVAPDATTPATGATGDVLGTYTPAGTPDGVKVLSLLMSPLASDSTVFGVTPA